MQLAGRFPLTPPFFTNRWWVAPYNFHPKARPRTVEGRRAYIHDVTLRDGEQALGVAFKEDERVHIAEALDEVGIQQIEVGMPSVAPSIFNATRRLVQQGTRARIVPQARAEMHDVERTMETGARSIIIVHTINPYHCQYAFDLDPEALIERVVAAVSFAKSRGLHTIFQASDVWRTDLEYALRVFTQVAAEAHPDAIVLTDTTGVATPMAVEFLVRAVARTIPDVTLEFHGHNDFGLATACALAAFMGGASGLHASFNGLGERTGNTPTEEIVATLEVLLDIRTGIRLNGLRYVSELVANIAKSPVRASKPVVGHGLFQIESHIVSFISTRLEQAGIPTGMLPFVPTLFGHDRLHHVLGKWSGRVAVEHHLERLGVQATEAQKEEILARVREESRMQKATISEEGFRHIVSAVLGGEGPGL